MQHGQSRFQHGSGIVQYEWMRVETTIPHAGRTQHCEGSVSESARLDASKSCMRRLRSPVDIIDDVHDFVHFGRKLADQVLVELGHLHVDMISSSGRSRKH